MSRRDVRFDVEAKHSLAVMGSFELTDMMLESPRSRSRTTSTEKRNWYTSRVLGPLGVLSIIYLLGCGGPIGSETIIYAGGPLIGLIAIGVYPLIMTAPYGYIVAELCAAFPQDGGFTVWTMHAFGPFWGFQVGYWMWISGIVNCAFLPGIFVEFVEYASDSDIPNGAVEYLLKFSVALVLSIPSLTGTIITSRVSMALLAASLLPFLIFTIWVLTEAKSSDYFSEVRRENTTVIAGTNDVFTSGDVDIDWPMLVNTLAWKFGGLTMASLFAGEVKNPAKAFPRAIGLTIALSFVSVILPEVAAIAAHAVPWPKFDDESALKEVGNHVGGSFLSGLVIFAGAAMSFGRFVSGLYCTSFQLSGMAEYDMLPHFVANKNNRFRSPQIAVLCTLVPILPALLLEFRHLLRVGNVFSCAVELFICATAIKLRLSMPYVPRPVKMPGGIFTLVLAMLGPATVVGYILYDSLLEAHTRAIVLIAIVPGLVHSLLKVRTQRKAAQAENPVAFHLSSSLSSSREIATPRFSEQ